MNSKIDELINSINNLSNFSFGDLISLIALIGSWITIFMLLKDKLENSRPYLQISFELVRSNLACIVIRNVGKVPLKVTGISYDDEFIKQLPEREQKHLYDNKINNLTIFPNKKWIICLGVIIPDILDKFDKKTLKVDYTYKKTNGFKNYKESTEIDFEQYSRFLVYISEIDELKQVNQKIEKNTKNLEKELKNIEANIVQFHNIQDKYMRTIVSGYTERSKDEQTKSNQKSNKK